MVFLYPATVIPLTKNNATIAKADKR